MKIERINDNQIRCTLNKKDLSDRELRINELAYGTDKAKELFRDMMQQASYELGFEAEDIPLMIEAIPVSSDCLVLIITKVEEPDELDTRFSKFSSESEENEENDDFNFEDEEEPTTLASILPKEFDATEKAEKSEEVTDFIPLSEAVSPQNVIGKESNTKSSTSSPMVNTIRIFSFAHLSEIIEMSKELHTMYHGANSLYKDPVKGNYYLILSKDTHSLEDFNKICNLASEFGKMERSNYGTLSYYEEHFSLISKANAMEVLHDL